MLVNEGGQASPTPTCPIPPEYCIVREPWGVVSLLELCLLDQRHMDIVCVEELG